MQQQKQPIGAQSNPQQQTSRGDEHMRQQTHEPQLTPAEYAKLQQRERAEKMQAEAASITAAATASKKTRESHGEGTDIGVAESYITAVAQENMGQLSMGAQFLMRPRIAPQKNQMHLAERRQKAENLLNRILRLKKPPKLQGKMNVMHDTKRILQTIFNTEHNSKKIEGMSMSTLPKASQDRNLQQPIQQEELFFNSDDSEAGNDEPLQRAAKLTEYQMKHLSFEREESRMIMNKRRKRPTPIEELDLTEFMPLVKIQKRTDGDPSMLLEEESTQAPGIIGKEQLMRDLIRAPIMNSEDKHLVVETLSTNFVVLAAVSEDSRSERVATLKQMANSFIVKSLTKSSKLSFDAEERAFFLEQVCEKNPDCLVEVCEFWLNTMFFKIPSQAEANSESQDRQYLTSLINIFGILETCKNLLTCNDQAFKEWVKLIQFLPRLKPTSEGFKEAEEAIQNHLHQILRFDNFKAEILGACLRIYCKAFLESTEANLIQYKKQKCYFTVLTDQFESQDLSPEKFDIALASLFSTPALISSSKVTPAGSSANLLDARHSEGLDDAGEAPAVEGKEEETKVPALTSSKNDIPAVFLMHSKIQQELFEAIEQEFVSIPENLEDETKEEHLFCVSAKNFSMLCLAKYLKDGDCTASLRQYFKTISKCLKIQSEKAERVLGHLHTSISSVMAQLPLAELEGLINEQLKTTVSWGLVEVCWKNLSAKVAKGAPLNVDLLESQIQKLSETSSHKVPKKMLIPLLHLTGLPFAQLDSILRLVLDWPQTVFNYDVNPPEEPSFEVHVSSVLNEITSSGQYSQKQIIELMFHLIVAGPLQKKKNRSQKVDSERKRKFLEFNLAVLNHLLTGFEVKALTAPKQEDGDAPMTIMINSSEILVQTLEFIVQKKAWACKVLVKALMELNKRNSKDFLHRTFAMIELFLEEGTSTLKSQTALCPYLQSKYNPESEEEQKHLLTEQEALWDVIKSGLILFFKLSPSHMKLSLVGMNSNLAEKERQIRLKLYQMLTLIPDLELKKEILERSDFAGIQQQDQIIGVQ